MKRAAWLLGVSCALLAGAKQASAQPASEIAVSADEQQQPARRSLSSRFGPSVAERLLSSPDEADKIRAVRRIAALNDFGAIQILLRTLGERPALGGQPRVMIEVVRALAPFASRDPARRLLLAWAGESSNPSQQNHPLVELARDEAAMALAASGDPRAIEYLSLLLATDGPANSRVATALRAHPPVHIGPLLTPRALSSVATVQLLGDLGDLRAIAPLRKVLDEAELAARAAAALSLGRLGDEYAAKQARTWAFDAGTTPAVREAAAETLVLLRASDAPRAVAVLLADAVTRDHGIALALRAPTAQLAPSLAGLVTIARPEQRAGTLMALAIAGSSLASRTLSQLADRHPNDMQVMFALAHCRHDGADEAIAERMKRDGSRRMAVRAALVRHAWNGHLRDDIDEAATVLLASKVSADRQLGAFARVVVDPGSFETVLASPEPEVRHGACTGALSLHAQARRACVGLIHQKLDASSRDALAVVLLGDERPRVPVSTLLDWAESPTPSAVVFAREAARQDSAAHRARLKQLLAVGGRTMRSQVHLGLAHSRDPSAVSVLVEAYAFEADATVRRAIIRALSVRSSAAAASLFNLAQRLDPDPGVRQLARLAQAGTSLAHPVVGRRMVWIQLMPSQPETRHGLSRGVVLRLPSEHAISTVSSADGFLLLPEMPEGFIDLAVAASGQSAHAPRP